VKNQKILHALQHLQKLLHDACRSLSKGPTWRCLLWGAKCSQHHFATWTQEMFLSFFSFFLTTNRETVRKHEKISCTVSPNDVTNIKPTRVQKLSISELRMEYT
jgi:hypothetical protein